MEEIRNHYDKLFNNALIEKDNNLMDKNQGRLNQAMSEQEYKIDKEILIHTIKKLNTNKATGYSNISNEFFKYAPQELIEILSNFYESIFNHLEVPQELNIGLTKLLIKDANKSNTDLDNTRPITLSDTIAIIFEQYVRSLLESTYQTSNSQFGFKKSASTSFHSERNNSKLSLPK
jgi:hypothetical protein